MLRGFRFPSSVQLRSINTITLAGARGKVVAGVVVDYGAEWLKEVLLGERRGWMEGHVFVAL